MLTMKLNGETKILFLNASSNGGAFIAAKRLSSVLDKGNSSIALKTFNDFKKKNLFKFYIIKIIVYFQQYLYKKSLISFGKIGFINQDLLNETDFDIIHLHWVNGGLISLKEIRKITKPIVWTLHDQWIVNGIRHTKLDNDKTWFLEKLNQKAIKKTISSDNIILVSPSIWLAKQVEKRYNKSCLIIPNPINTDSSTKIKLPNSNTASKRIIFLHTSKNDYHKGFDLLLEAIKHLKFNVELLTTVKEKINLNFVRSIDYVKSEKELFQIIQSADIVAVPSRIDNYPNVCLEAKLHKKPVLAFRIGGIPEIIEHLKEGYLATPFDTTDLRKGIEFLLSKQFKYEENEKGKSMTEYIFNTYQNLYACQVQ